MGIKDLFRPKYKAIVGNIIDLEFNKFNKIGSKIVGDIKTAMLTYTNYYEFKALGYNDYQNSRAIFGELMAELVTNDIVYLIRVNGKTYIALNYNENQPVTITINNQIFTVYNQVQEVYTIYSPFNHAHKEIGNILTEQALNSVYNSLQDSGKIKGFVFSRIDATLKSAQTEIENKINAMNETASRTGGYTFLRQDDKFQQLQPDYSNAGTPDLERVLDIAYATYGASTAIIDSTASDNQKITFMTRTIEFVTNQLSILVPNFTYTLLMKKFTSVYATGGLNLLPEYREALIELEDAKAMLEVQKTELLSQIQPVAQNYVETEVVE